MGVHSFKGGTFDMCLYLVRNFFFAIEVFQVFDLNGQLHKNCKAYSCRRPIFAKTHTYGQINVLSKALGGIENPQRNIWKLMVHGS
jgi:hypothetical protein